MDNKFSKGLEKKRPFKRGPSEKWKRLHKASLIQKSLIQRDLPIMELISIKALFLPGKFPGGDFFRIISGSHEKKLMVIIGDCPGQGLKTSMAESLLISLIDPYLNILLKGETGRFLEELSREFYRKSDEKKFPTMTVVVIDGETGLTHYSNANGELPLLTQRNRVRQLETAKGMPIAHCEDPSYETKSFQLEPGDRLLFFSGALPEMRTDQKNRLGYKKFMDIVSEENGSTNSRSFYSLLDRVEALNGTLPLDDDLALISLQFLQPIERTNTYFREKDLEDLLSQNRRDLEKMDYKKDEILRTDIVLRELYLNAFHHGNRGDERRKILVKSHVDCSGYSIVIEDEGEGFDRRTVEDPVGKMEEIFQRGIEREYTHGRGIVIAEQFTDSLEYNEKGNAVSLKLKRKGNRLSSYN